MPIEEWRERFGWIVGALVIMIVLAAAIARYGTARPLRMVHLIGIAVGLGIGGFLFIPAVPRILTAFRQMIEPRIPMETSGPFPVASVDVPLSSASAKDAPIPVQIWYPAGEKPARAKRREGRPCSDLLADEILADGASQPFPLLLYAPGNGSLGNDSASTAAELASHGYVVMAIDDIERDPHLLNPVQDNPPPLVFDYSSQEAFENFLRAGDHKVRREAEQALAALDRLTACADADWCARVSFDRVGFFGFSFGGSVAAEAATIDPRIVAAANLDGTLFDRAASGALKKPYIVFLTREDVFPKPRELESPDPSERYFAVLMKRDLQHVMRQANQRDGFALRIRNSYHENLSDQAFSRSFFRTWFFANPYRVKMIRDAYLLAFFDNYLRGLSSPLLARAPSPFEEVELLQADPYWLAEAAKAAIEVSADPN